MPTGDNMIQNYNIKFLFLLVLAIELLCACQGIEFLRPLKTTQPLESVYALVRSVAKYVDFLGIVMHFTMFNSQKSPSQVVALKSSPALAKHYYIFCIY